MARCMASMRLRSSIASEQSSRNSGRWPASHPSGGGGAGTGMWRGGSACSCGGGVASARKNAALPSATASWNSPRPAASASTHCVCCSRRMCSLARTTAHALLRLRARVSSSWCKG
jgi:hypothetical protein